MTPRTLALGVALLLTGCRDAAVLARVGDVELRKEDVAWFAAERRAAPGGTLDDLIARARLAELGREEQLLEDPAVRAKVDAAAREALVAALLDRARGSATSQEALRARFEMRRDALTRRQLELRALVVRPASEDPAARAAAENRARTLYARLRTGEAFEQVVLDADDPIGAARGGRLGPLREGELDPAFFERAAALHAGELSEPFWTTSGMHVVRAEREPVALAPEFEAVRARLAAELAAEADAAVMERARSEVSVTRYDGAAE